MLTNAAPPATVVSAWLSAPSSESFLVFNSIWSLLVLAYIGFAPLYFTRLFHRLASLALLAVTTIFWFAGAVAFAAFVGPFRRNCGPDGHCGSARAGVVFAFFLWALFSFLLVLDSLEAMRSRKHTEPGGATTAAKPPTYAGA